MKLSIYGAGAWGTAIAVNAAARHDTVLWVRRAEQAAAMRTERRNAAYLADVTLPASLAVTDDFAAANVHAEGGLHIVATPMSALRAVLGRLAGAAPPHDPGDAAPGVLWLCKGFEQGSGALGHEIARDVLTGWRSGVLSGPSFALEVARGQPTALVAASADATLGKLAAEVFHGGSLRVYTSSDPIGVEVGGAVKNVLAIATGIADGMGLGLNARAAIITRGLAEMTRLGLALGGRADTFMGLSGLGDLVLTATGELSRNRRVGLLLAEGRQLADVLATLGHVAEGVHSARTVLDRAVRLGVDMPITHAVVEVLDGRWSAGEAVNRLVRRDAKAE